MIRPIHFRTLLGHSGSMLLRIISCEDKNNQEDNAECNVNVLADTCSNTNSVWLNCNNGTGDGGFLSDNYRFD